MIEWIKNWVNQIIVAVIIATILEMIIPEGNNKKYIKMIIGIYVLFTIIQPVLGNNINLSKINYYEYFSNYVDTTSIQSINDKVQENENLVEQTYIESIKKDIISKIEQKGYIVDSINVSTVGNKQSNNYGKISSLKLKINKEEKIVNNVKINNIKIESNTENSINTTLTQKEKENLKEYLIEEYSIEKDDVIIE